MKVLALSPDAKRLEVIARHSQAVDSVGSMLQVTGRLEGQAVLPVKDKIDLLVLDCPSDTGVELDRLEQIAPLYPGMTTILITDDTRPETLMRALRAGVREVVQSPIINGDLVDALRREGDKHRSPATSGKVLACISCKGGSGATFVAANLGYALASASDKRVLLIDLNPQFGDAALFLTDKRITTSLADVARDVGRLDAAFLQASVLQVLPNYSVLAAPEDPTLLSEVRAEHIDALLRFARAHYDYVILDVGRTLDQISIRALDIADQVYPVLQLTLPFVRDGKHLMGVFRTLDYPREKIRPLVNRYEKSSDLTLEDLEKTLGVKVFATLPNDYQASATSVNQGVAVLKLHRTSAISKGLVDLAARIDDIRVTDRPLLRRLFGRAA